MLASAHPPSVREGLPTRCAGISPQAHSHDFADELYPFAVNQLRQDDVTFDKALFGLRAVGSVVVLGASGFIGTRLVGDLSQRGEKVRALDIVPPRQRIDGVSYERIDVRGSIPRSLGEGVDVIYNLAAVHRSPGHKCHEYYATNVLGALNVTDFARKSDIPVIVFLSSISVYGPSEERITEAAPMTPTSDYGLSKLIAEGVHKGWLQETSGRRLITVRPGVVFGPGERGNYTRLADALRRRMFAYPGRKTTVKSGGHVDELLSAIDFALERPDREITFNFAYPDEATTEDIVRTFSSVAGFAPRHPVLPAFLMLAAAGLCEAANLLGLPNSLHRERVMKLVQSTRIAPQWLLEHGFEFRTNLASALERWRDETNGLFQ